MSFKYMVINRLKYLFFHFYILLNILLVLIDSTDSIPLIRIIQVLGSLLFILEIATLNSFKYIHLRNILLTQLLLLFIFATASGLYHNNIQNSLVIFNLIGFYGAGLFFTHYPKPLWVFPAMMLSVSFLFAFYISQDISVRYWTKGSYNHISVLMLFLAVTTYLDRLKNGKEFNLLPSALALLFSLYGRGRAGILSSLLLLIFVIYFIYFTKKFKFIYLLLGCLLATLFLTFYEANIDAFLQSRLIGFERKGFEDVHRQLIINEFITNIKDWRQLFFGIDYSYYLDNFNLTIHNSYISIHARFGIMLLLILFQMFQIFYIGTINKFRYSALLIILLVRSFFDTILIADGYLFGTAFYCIYIYHIDNKLVTPTK